MSYQTGDIDKQQTHTKRFTTCWQNILTLTTSPPPPTINGCYYQHTNNLPSPQPWMAVIINLLQSSKSQSGDSRQQWCWQSHQHGQARRWVCQQVPRCLRCVTSGRLIHWRERHRQPQPCGNTMYKCLTGVERLCISVNSYSVNLLQQESPSHSDSQVLQGTEPKKHHGPSCGLSCQHSFKHSRHCSSYNWISILFPLSLFNCCFVALKRGLTPKACTCFVLSH